MQANRTFRIFVSSTFTDMMAERNALQENLFPRLRDLCTRHGCRFQAIDLRWGVSDEAGMDHQTMKICLEEIVRCQTVTPRPNFIVLLGERYGWRPLPAGIPEKEFEKIEKRVTNQDDLSLLQSWYERDDNALPALYCLRPREGEFKDLREWEAVERELRSILTKAIAKVRLKPERRLVYEGSATEQEIVQGVLNVKDAQEHVFCFLRKTKDPTVIQDARDVDPGELDGARQIDPEPSARLEQLKSKLRDALGQNVFVYESDGTQPGLPDNHLAYLCDDVFSPLSGVILQEIERLERGDSLTKEVKDHQLFGKERARFFTGRDDILREIKRYVGSEDRRPLAIVGASGSGKSAVMARAAAETGGDLRAATIVTRFIGATPASSDGRSLLESLCRQISRKYRSKEPPPAEYRELIVDFPKRLALASAEKPLIIFLDALDQLSDADHARDLSWLPTELPDNVRLIVSTTPGPSFSVLKRKLPARYLIQLEPMTIEEGQTLLGLWLKDTLRTLQPKQLAEVLDKFERCGLPLYLKLAFEEVRNWQSSDTTANIAEDIPGIIHRLFKRLSNETHHGEVMVSRSLGYLVAAKNGLMEDELLDVLSKDEKVMTDFARRSPKSPEAKRLPVVVWSRLYFDLAPYLAQRSVDGATLLAFYHRQLSDAAIERYLTGEDKIERHRALAAYFAGQPLQAKKDSGTTPNLRKLTELPYQQMSGELWQELEATLVDLEFVETKCAADMTYSLAADYNAVLTSERFPRESHPAVEEFSRFVRSQTSLLKAKPGLVFQLAVNEPAASRPSQNAFHRFERGLVKRPWLRLINKARHGSVYLMKLAVSEKWTLSPDGSKLVSGGTLLDATTGEELVSLGRGLLNRIDDWVFSPDGEQLLGTDGENVALHDATTGAELATLSGYRTKGISVGWMNIDLEMFLDRIWNVFNARWKKVMASGFTSDKGLFVTAVRPLNWSLKIRDATTGRKVRTLRGFRDRVSYCAFSPDGNRIVSSYGKTLKLWDTRTGKRLLTLNGHHYPVNRCQFSSDGTKMLSGAEDAGGELETKLWDTSTGMELAVSDGLFRSRSSSFAGSESHLGDCALSPDGELAISADGRTLKLFHIATGETLANFYGHNSQIETCAFSCDGKRVLASSAGRLIIWDATIRQQADTQTDQADIEDICAFSPNGNQFATVSSSKLVVRDANTGQKLRTIGEDALLISDCAFSPDGAHLVTASDYGRLGFWNLIEGTGWKARKRDIRGQNESWNKPTCAFSPNGERVVSLFFGRVLTLWDAAAAKKIADLSGHEKTVNACAFSLDGSRIVSASDDRTLKLWDGSTGEEILTIHAGVKVNSCAFSPDGTRILSVGEPGKNHFDSQCETQARDAATGAEIWRLNERAVSSFSPEGTLLICVAGPLFQDELKIWDPQSSSFINTLSGHMSHVKQAAFSPDGQWVASADADSVKLWDVHTTQLLCEYNMSAETLQWSPDGTKLVLQSFGDLRLLELKNLSPRPLVVTAWSSNSDGCAFGCPHCRRWSKLSTADLGRKISCPRCTAGLKLNSFVVTAEWQPVANAWRPVVTSGSAARALNKTRPVNKRKQR